MISTVSTVPGVLGQIGLRARPTVIPDTRSVPVTSRKPPITVDSHWRGKPKNSGNVTRCRARLVALIVASAGGATGETVVARVMGSVIDLVGLPPSPEELDPRRVPDLCWRSSRVTHSVDRRGY